MLVFRDVTTANHWNQVGFHDNPENTPGGLGDPMTDGLGGLASPMGGHGEIFVLKDGHPFFESWSAFFWGKKWFNVRVKHYY